MDSSTVHREIHELLQHFCAQVDTPPPLTGGGQEGTEVIDIYIVRQVEEAEPLIVEGTLETPPNEQESDQQAPVEQETDEPPYSPGRHKAHRRVLPFLVGALCVLLAGRSPCSR